MTPERLKELKKYCELWDGKDYNGFEIEEIRWLIAEVERLRFKSQQLSKATDRLLKISENAYSEIDHLREKLLHTISEQLEEILTAFVAKYGCGPDEVQRSPDGEKYWVRLRRREEGG